MKTLFNAADAAEIIQRIEKLSSNANRQWGKMQVAQMLAHCNQSLNTAMGINHIKRAFIGKIIGGFFKKKALGEKPFGKNSPTDKSYIFKDDRNFEEEKSKTINAIRKFSEGGPSRATTHPHPFFGKMEPEEWGIFEWKHMDHHLRQFGA